MESNELINWRIQGNCKGFDKTDRFGLVSKDGFGFEGLVWFPGIG